MSGWALVEKEFLSLLRGWRMVAFLAATGILATGFILGLTTEQKGALPNINMEIAGFFISLQMVLCLGLFASDLISSSAKDGTLQLYLLLPRKRRTVLLAKFVPPVVCYFIGIVMFSVMVISIPSGTAFLKLWWANVAVDTLLFFSLLFLVSFISVSSNGTSGPITAFVILMLLLFFSPFIPINLAFLNPINPFAYGYDLIKDMSNGILDNSMPAGVLVIIMLVFAAMSFFVMARKEVTE
jgi:ABC-type transport system involved in multi-copper enzyme maturation permease subunit